VAEGPRKFREVVSRFNGLPRVTADNFQQFLTLIPGSKMGIRQLLPATLLFLLVPAWADNASAPASPARIPPPAVAPAGSLYERLGGTPKVTLFVGETIDRVATNPATMRSFDKVNLQHVKDMLVEQICSLSGGGCQYSGDTMRDVHAGHRITNAEFYDLVAVLRESMRAQDVPLSARNELLEILAPMKRDVVKL
jgi:hemoglobin